MVITHCFFRSRDEFSAVGGVESARWLVSKACILGLLNVLNGFRRSNGWIARMERLLSDNELVSPPSAY